MNADPAPAVQRPADPSAPRWAGGAPLRILVVDDSAPARARLGLFVRELGHQALYAEDGAAAVRACLDEQPDCVLMDVVMPGLDGIQAVREIRARMARWFPIIYLSALGGERAIEGLAAGGDDFIAKPIDLPQLAAKLGAFRRIIDLHAASRAMYERMEREHLLACEVVKAMVPAPPADSPARVWLRPAETLSGDVVLSARGPRGEWHAMVADATGHGLVAAVCLQPAVEAFNSMSAKGFTAAAIAAEINRKLHRLLPRGYFLAGVMITLDPVRGCVEIWNGGMPPVLALDRDGTLLRRVSSSQPPLGVLPETEFEARVERICGAAPLWIVACSDGLVEARGPGGEEFGLARLEAALRGRYPEQGWSAARSAVEGHLAGLPAHDDISLAMIGYQPGVRAPRPAPER